MAAAAIWEFRNREILLADEVQKAKTHHHAKYHSRQLYNIHLLHRRTRVSYVYTPM